MFRIIRVVGFKTQYRIQKKSLFRWYDYGNTEFTSGDDHCFETYEEALLDVKRLIDDLRGRNKSVVSYHKI